jgi:hypothetical protein
MPAHAQNAAELLVRRPSSGVFRFGVLVIVLRRYESGQSVEQGRRARRRCITPHGSVVTGREGELDVADL